MALANATVGIVGALAAFPRRLVAREIQRQGGTLQRGITRQTTHVVFGRSLLERGAATEIVSRYDAVIAAGQVPLSEGGFLRKLGLRLTPADSAMSVQAMRDQSQLDPRDLSMLSLFDAFEHDAAPYSFRDLILAKKYAGLVASGASWLAIARSVHRAGKVASLTALSLQVGDGDAIYSRDGETLSELDGQSLLPLDQADDNLDEDVFAAAEAASHEGKFETAAALYRQCLALDPTDAVVAFNLANSLKSGGRMDEAAHAFAMAIKLDTKFVEAWFNLAALLKDQGRTEAARSHLNKAISIDPNYADAIYNLAALEYDAGKLAEARRWWSRYLELDQTSNWAKIASRGVQFVDRKIGARMTAG